MVDLNLNTLNVDKTGRASFSGLSTGIDFQGAVDSIIAAKRIPIDTLETKVGENEEKITALGEVRSALESVRQSLSRLYGAVTFGNTGDIFKAKSAFATTSRIDGATPSEAGNLLGVTATSAAAAGTHTIEVLQTASAHKVASGALTSQTDALAELAAGDRFVINAGLGYHSSVQPSADTQAGSAGTIEFTTIAGSTSLGSVAYGATDTLTDIADNINANVADVSASVVASGSGVRLEITATEAVDITETGGGTLLTDLAITDRNEISVTGTESLVDLRDLINNAKTGVTASIASVSTTEHYLVLTRDVTGSEMVIRDTAGDALESLGVLTSGGAIANQLSAGATAKFYADGLLDQTDLVYESALQSSATVQIGSTGTLEFRRNSDSGLIGSVNYDAADTLDDLAADISAIAGLSASVVGDGAGVRLEITGDEAFGISEAGGGSAIADLGIDNKRLEIERSTNTIDDLFAGVTLSLFQAEQGTTVKIDVERDLSAVKNEITGFVESYNAFKEIVNTHRQFNTATGTKSEDAGVLFSSAALAESNTALGRLIGEGVAGVEESFRVLAQIGITLVDNTTLEDPLLANTLEIDEAALDTALLNNPDEVRRLFAFDFQASDPRVTLLSFTAETAYNAAGYTLNVATGAGSGTNLVSYSEQADDAYWTKQRLSVAADATTAPDASSTADGLIVDASAGPPDATLSTGTPLSVTAGQTYVLSTHVKRGTAANGDLVRIGLSGAGTVAPDGFAEIDLDTGAITQRGAGIDDVQVQDLGNGYYRLSAAVTPFATGDATLEITSSDSVDGTAYAGDGVNPNLYVWGTQVDRADVPIDEITSFTTSEASVVTDFANAPNGLVDAEGIVASTALSEHVVGNAEAISAANGEAYSFTVYAKAGSRDHIRVRMGSQFAANTYVEVDLSTGTQTALGGGADSATIEDAGNGFYRIRLNATATASGDADFELLPSDGLLTTYIGANDPANPDVLFWRPEVHQSTDLAPKAYEATTSPASEGIATANVDGPADGTDDGSASVVDGVVTVQTGDATGLKVLAEGITSTSSIQLDFTVGFATKMFFELDALLDKATGAVETEISNLSDQNELNNDRIAEMETRLEIQRQSLLDRFIRMETALATANRILDGIRQTTEALLNTGNG